MALATKRVVMLIGTGTGVGKTTCAQALVAGLSQVQAVLYWKPVQTGDENDAALVRQVAPKAVVPEPACRFSLAASPDQAARAAGAVQPTVASLLAAYHALPIADVAWVVIEGAGGLLVPLNDAGETWADLLKALNAAPLVVGATGLGTLNHCGLTLQALRGLGLPAVGLVLSGERHAANEQSLARLYPRLPQFHLPTVVPSAHLRFGDGWGEACQALAAFAQAQVPWSKSASAASWTQLAERHVWYPYTQHSSAPKPLPLVAAHDVWLTTADGARLFDATSAWWVNTVGHGRPEIGQAIQAQQQKLDHVLFAGAVHEGAARLAAELAAMAGGKLSRVFFSDNGSTAVEIALKIAYQGWVNRGISGRTKFLSFRGSYHGDTFGAMSVAQASGFHGAFKPLLFEVVAAPVVTEHPSALCPEGLAALGPRLEELAQLFAKYKGELAGVVLEPLLQGAGGMLVQPPAFVRGVAALAREHGVPLIFDEVLTGLGRIGAPFAFHRAGVKPDLVALAKGLTGGTLPLAVTLASEELFAQFLASEPGDKARALLHGHSFTANAVACAAALAALSISRREDLPGRALLMEARFKRWLASTGKALAVLAPRAIGGVMAFELPGSGHGDYFHPKASQLSAVAQQHGLFMRPLGNTVYFLPPLATRDADLDWALAALGETLAQLLDH